jgi:c-di-GMP-binding flagellar brake protein YcgR
MTLIDRSLPEVDSVALLEAACERNLSVEVHYHAAHGELFVARSRLLALDDRHVYIDNPQAIGSDESLRTKQDILVHFNLHDCRYVFDTQVVRQKALVPLNEKKSVVGMMLSRPTRIRDGQRRNHFRVSLVAEEMLGIEVRHACTDEGAARPADGRPMHGALINLSLGGVALRLDIADGRDLTLDSLVFLRFFLPDDESDYRLLGAVRQLRPVADHTAMRLGLKFKCWPDEREYDRTQQRLQRYITRVQREQLRRAG